MKLGTAFSDALMAEKRTTAHMASHQNKAWWFGAGRALLFATLLYAAFFLLLFRLFMLTVTQGNRYRTLADGNRTRELIRHAERGLLFDRTGKPLVANIAQYRLLKPCPNKEDKTCVQHISQKEGEAIHAKGSDPGWYVETEYKRQYVYPEATAHIVGYTGELTDTELADDYYALRKYYTGDRIGRTGAEAVFEDQLRGRDGRELVEIDATGKIVRVLGRDNEVAGENITLSLDAHLNEVVKNAFPAGQKGAVVVANPNTGEILALYSSPSFSLNDFTLGMSEQNYTSLVDNPDRPMFDRAISGVYPPGSTFKLVTSIAAFETGVIDRQTTIEDTGVIKLGIFSFPNWYFLQYGKTEGFLNIVSALKRSNDIFFYHIGERVGITRLAEWARRLGVGKLLGIELPGEASGLMPDPAWKNLNFVSAQDRQARSNEWYTGDTYHVSIGQGYLLTTPLQVNAWTNAVANGGKLCTPTIKRTRPSADGSMIRTQHCKDLGIKEETIRLITEGMREACDAGGTGWPFFNFSINKLVPSEASPSGTLTQTFVPVACKTGTAEFGDSKNRTHAWFTAFAPLPEEIALKGVALQGSPVITGGPEISVTVLVEEAGEGSDVAAPIAKKILEEWFKR